MKVKAIQMPVKSDVPLFVVMYVEMPADSSLNGKYYHHTCPVSSKSQGILLAQESVAEKFHAATIEWEYLSS